MTGSEPQNSYLEAIGTLYSLRWFGAKFGLDNTLRLAEQVGNPQRQLRFVHVAGTNGKGSTCAMLESIYRATGLRVGLFTSPHLVSFRERIQVNRELISQADVVRLVDDMRRRLEEFRGESHPTFFETVTVMALQYFAEKKCDLVIWETGLGGRLDATNIVTPLVSAITNIQYDHQKWLGETLASIAAEKAGIIKPGVPVVTATDEPVALKVIADRASALGAPLIQVDVARVQAGGRQVDLPLPGEHQRVNAAVALAAIEVLQRQLPVPESAKRSGLASVNWPGRLQLVVQPGGPQLLLDGAHNVDGAKVLAATLRKDFAAARPTLILGILRDKDWPAICQVLAPLAHRIFTVPVQNERTASADELAAACRGANPTAHVTPLRSLNDALSTTPCDPFIVVTGSLYLVGEAMERLNLLPATEPNERGLNEWIGDRSPAASATP